MRSQLFCIASRIADRFEVTHSTRERMRWAVWRRFSAFEKARGEIRKAWREVPPLPPKTAFSLHGTSTDVAQQRMTLLEAWLREVLASPEALAVPATLELIGFSEAKEKMAESHARAAVAAAELEARQLADEEARRNEAAEAAERAASLLFQQEDLARQQSEERAAAEAEAQRLRALAEAKAEEERERRSADAAKAASELAAAEARFFNSIGLPYLMLLWYCGPSSPQPMVSSAPTNRANSGGLRSSIS